MIVASDTFVRANDPSSWGTSSGGQVWSKLIGSDTLAIVSNEGQITSVASAFDTVMLIGGGTLADVENHLLVRIAAQNSGPVIREQNNGTYYRLVIEGGTLYLQVCVGFSFSTIQNVALSGFSSADFWHMLLKATGTSFEATAWKDGTMQPLPQISATDATIALSGGYGLTSVGGGSGVNHYTSIIVSDGATPPVAHTGRFPFGNHRPFGRIGH